MVDLKSHIKAIKLFWISKLIKNNHNQFSTILENSLLSISKITKLGSDWLKGFNKKIYNPFWKEVFSILIIFSENQSITNTRERLLSSLWFNPKISKNKLFLPKWFSNGITLVGDILNNQGETVSQVQL